MLGNVQKSRPRRGLGHTTKAAAKSNWTDLKPSKQFFLAQNSTTTTTPNMLILIFKYKSYVDNHFTELIPHEIVLWCCKIGILEVC